MLRSLVLVMVACSAPQKRPAPSDDVWRDRVVKAANALTSDSLVPAKPAVIAAAGFRAIGETGDNPERLAERIGERIANKTLDAPHAWLAIAAMADVVDDPHTLLVSPSVGEQFVGAIEGAAFTTPGIVVAWTPDHHLIATEVLDGPAKAAGLAAGDVITAINGALPRSWTVRPASFVAPGSDVAIDKIHYAAQPYLHPVSAHRVVGVGILHPYFFAKGKDPTRNATELAKQALAAFDAAKVTAIVLDLRGNQGGEGVSDYVSLFTEAEPILVAKPKNEPEVPWANAKTLWPTKRKIAVLVDEQTISAAEMVALALRTHAGARVFGQPTGGCMNVPNPVDLGENYALMIPVVPVAAPKAAFANQLQPDELVPNRTADDVRANRDPQLDAALKWLR